MLAWGEAAAGTAGELMMYANRSHAYARTSCLYVRAQSLSCKEAHLFDSIWRRVVKHADWQP